MKLELPFLRDETALIGVSGGRDSVALLHALINTGYQNLIICHVNHSLRGESSVQDSEFVDVLASTFNLPIEMEKVDVREIASQEKVSLETAGRLARHSFFAAIARKHSVSRVLLGHHADDQVETILMNFFRGTSPGGISGMPLERPINVEGVPLILTRPLLYTSREAINLYLDNQSIAYCEDLTNQDDTFLRNRVRKLVPQLESIFDRDIRDSVTRFATLLGEQHQWIHSLATATLTEELHLPDLHSLPLPVLREKLHAWLSLHKVPDISSALIDSIIPMINPQHPVAKVNLPGGRFVRRREKLLFIE